MKPSRSQVTNVRPAVMYMSGERLWVPRLAKTRSPCHVPPMYFLTMRSDGPDISGNVVRDQMATGIVPLYASVGLPSSMVRAVVVTWLIPSPVPDENNSVWANSPPGPTCLDHTPNHRPSRAMMSPEGGMAAGQVST